MRGKRAKVLRDVAKDLKAANPDQFGTISLRRVYRRLKQVWFLDAEFRKSVIKQYSI